MTRDPKIVVAQAYDRIAEVYIRRFGTSAVRQFWLDELIARLSAGAHVLDLPPPAREASGGEGGRPQGRSGGGVSANEGAADLRASRRKSAKLLK